MKDKLTTGVALLVGSTTHMMATWRGYGIVMSIGTALVVAVLGEDMLRWGVLLWDRWGKR